MGASETVKGQNGWEQRGKDKHSPAGVEEEPARLQGAVQYLRGS